MKTLSISVPDALASELLAYKSVAFIKTLLIKVIADVLREGRVAAAESVKPAVIPVDDQMISVNII